MIYGRSGRILSNPSDRQALRWQTPSKHPEEGATDSEPLNHETLKGPKTLLRHP